MYNLIFYGISIWTIQYQLIFAVVMPLVLRWRRWISSGGGYGSESRIIRLFRDSPLRSHRSKDLRDRSGLIRSCAEAAAGEYVFKHTHNQQLVPLLRFLEVFDGYDTPPAALINNNKSSSSMPPARRSSSRRTAAPAAGQAPKPDGFGL